MTRMSVEIISVSCPKCEKELVLPDRSFLGRFALCPQCSQKFVLALADKRNDPEPPTEAPPPSPPSKTDQPKTAAATAGSKEDKAKLSPLARMKAAAAEKKGDGQTASSKKPPGQAKGKPSPKGRPLPKKASAAANEPIPRAKILKGFYLTNVRPFLAFERSRKGRIRRLVTAKMFAQARNNLPPQLHGVLNQLQSFCDERRQFTVHQKLHRTLHSWLLVHIPASIALFVLLAVHIVVALRVIPWTP